MVVKSTVVMGKCMRDACEDAEKPPPVDPTEIRTSISPSSAVELNTTSAVTLPVLDPKRYGLDKQERFKFSGILSTASEEGTLQEAVQFLEKTYCDKISAEFEDLEEEEEIEWFTKRIEQIGSEDVDKDMQVALATELLKSQTLDKFLATKFVTLKRYGGEGAESMMAFIMELLRLSAKDGVEQIVIGMPHRGRFNLLTGLLRLSPVQLFRKFKGLSEFPTNVKATGDVASHLSEYTAKSPL
uniref:Uncharacterized protein n=1 Tax=Timema bartmani TaxID=61472 RepID=A0A7R9FBB7_9NEOP|nr:unnamed protein product [Timema bartmani]